VLYYLRKSGFDKAKAEEKWIFDVCASFQAAVVDVLADKLISAAQTHGVSDIAVVGGVSANGALRRRLEFEANHHRLNLFLPKLEYCTDNGAMVAMAGYEKMKRGIRSSLELTAEPNLQMAS
jgi:N6-L-threonylcarbamoyladenine synthase